MDRHLGRGFGSLVIAGLLIVSGCLGGFGGTTPAPGTDRTPTPYEPPDFDQLSVDDGTVVVNHTYTDDHTEYIDETDSVRYVRVWRHANQSAGETGSGSEREPVYDTMNFEQWGGIQCRETMGDGVMTILHRNTETTLSGILLEYPTGDRQITVRRTTTLDRDGNVVSEPSISFQRLSTVTPNEAAATLTFANRSYSCRADVAVTNQTVQLE